ncbi:MAG: hypothetical protein ACKVOX_05720 [Rhizobacter sp.]
MPSQLELLKGSLARLEPTYGAENPLVQGLKMQIAMHERDEWRRANGGWFGPAAGWLQQPSGEGQSIVPVVEP